MQTSCLSKMSEGPIWTSNDAPDNLRAIVLLFRASKKGDIGNFFPFNSLTKHPRYSHLRGMSPAAPREAPAPPGDELAKEISTLSASGWSSAVSQTAYLAVRLGVEGFMDACNALVRTLFTVFPNGLDVLTQRAVHSLEILWEGTGRRPDVPWNAATPDQFDEWEKELYETRRFPLPEDLEDIFETIVIRIGSDDPDVQPYGLSGAIAMALDIGRADDADRWLQMLYGHFTLDKRRSLTPPLE
jgi:hypothetical protein